MLWSWRYVGCTIVTVYLPSGIIVAKPVDPKLRLWLGLLATLTAFNVGLWIWAARAVSPANSYAETQLLLAAVYVGVCGFRSLFPRVDLERVCLWDSWLSTIFIGRTAATIAEVCFALQCSLFVHRLAELTGLPLLADAAQAFVPIAVIAEMFCWHAVLSLNHIGHAIEETLWAALMLMLAVACGMAAGVVDGPLCWMLMAGCVVYGVGAALTMAFDVTMYVRRWRLRAADTRLTLATGLWDTHSRRHPTFTWEVWREEAPWMTLYFSVGVWTSLAMVLL